MGDAIYVDARLALYGLQGGRGTQGPPLTIKLQYDMESDELNEKTKEI